MVPRAFFATWNRHSPSTKTSRDDPCLKFYGLWLITIMDVNGVYIYIYLLTYIINPIHIHYILRSLYLRNLLALDLTDVLV